MRNLRDFICIYILVTFYIALLLGTLKNVDLFHLTNFLMFADVCLLFLSKPHTGEKTQKKS